MLSPRPCFALALLSLSCAPAPPPVAPAAPRPSDAAVAAFPSATAAPADPSRDLASKIDPIFAEYAKPGSPGCAVGVYRAGEVLFAKGYGLANLDYGQPIDEDTVFEIHSVSKQFTAAAIALLVEDGKLSLDDDVRKYVPELPVYGKPITVAHLLHHTSGLRDYAGLLELSGFAPGDHTNDDDVLFAIDHQKGLNFPPGSQFSYSNSNYFLLSLLVKRVTGKSLASFAKERLFEPLGMKDTLFLDDPGRVIPHRATGYRRTSDGFDVDMMNSEAVGARGVQSSIADLARWDANFYDPKVGGKTFLERMRTPGKLDNGDPVSYALGLVLGTAHGLAVETHDGGGPGYASALVRYPTERLTVACLCNLVPVESAEPDALPDALSDAVATAILPKASPSPASPDAAVSPATDAPKTMDPSPAELAPIVGAYYDPMTFEVRTISQKDGEILLGFGVEADTWHRPLVAIDARTFVVKPHNAGDRWPIMTRYAFQPAARGLPARLARTSKDGKAATLERVDPSPPSPTALAEYAGRYTTDELRMDWSFRVVDGHLEQNLWGRTLRGDALTSMARDTFRAGAGDDMEGIRFERDARGKVRGFVLIAGQQVRGIRWSRR